jgi:predicted dehydrogenase
MAENYKVAMIGCGRPLRTDGSTGFGMAHRHMAGYAVNGRCELVAVADIKAENAEAFVQEHNPDARVYADYMEMMRAESPDVVSICLWPRLHAQVVCDIAPLQPRAIHCEKPMDVDWDAALAMHHACREAGVQLTINHQRRFNKPFLKAKSLLDDDAIGPITRMDAAWGNLFDSGTHWLDMMFYFNNESPAIWALGQIDIRGAGRAFGALCEGQGLVTFHCENGVRATMFAGLDHQDLGCMIRVFGERGILEILPDAPWMRMHQFAQPGWQEFDFDENIHDDAAIYRGIDDLLDCLESGDTPLLSSDHAIRATEIIFAAYESSRRRARVNLPLEPGPSALLAMVDSGEMVLEEKD